MKRKVFAVGSTLGGEGSHIYVTRAATLQYQAIRKLPFEEARRELTKLLLPAEQDPANRRAYLFHDFDTRSLRAYVVEDGRLRLVGSVCLAEKAGALIAADGRAGAAGDDCAL